MINNTRTREGLAINANLTPHRPQINRLIFAHENKDDNGSSKKHEFNPNKQDRRIEQNL